MARRSSMLCPSCGKLISVDEERCPHCGAWRPGLWGLGPVLAKTFGKNFSALPWLMQFCGFLFVVSVGLDVESALSDLSPMSALSPGWRPLYLLGMTGGAAWEEGHWWTLLTATYLHGGIVHIGFNLFALRDLGRSAEKLFGPARFFVLFTLSGIGGFLLSNVLEGVPTVGASCSVFGLIGALGVFGWKRGGTWGRHLFRRMLIWGVAGVGLGFLMPNTNNLGHIGGLIAGVLVAFAMPARDRVREGRGPKLLAAFFVVLTLVAFGLSVATMNPLLRPPG